MTLHSESVTAGAVAVLATADADAKAGFAIELGEIWRDTENVILGNSRPPCGPRARRSPSSLHREKSPADALIAASRDVSRYFMP